MCGIFGAIGNRINPGIIRALAIANRERGTDSLGLFDNTGKSVKRAADPFKCLVDAKFDEFIGRACSKGWFIAGHTRYATHGKVTDRNAHPFRFGNIIGTHNGIVKFPKERDYRVDSEYLFDQLSRHGGDYQTALEDIDGYWGIAWFDGANFWLQTHNQELAIVRAADDVWYYSSDAAHLAACTGRPEVLEFGEGTTIRFALNSSEFEAMPDFKSKQLSWWKRSATAKQGGAKKSKKRDKSKYAADAADMGYVGYYKEEDNVKPMTWREECEDIDYADDLAQVAGYKDVEDFMFREGIAGYDRAIAMLEDAFWVESEAQAHWEDDDRNSVWRDDVRLAD